MSYSSGIISAPVSATDVQQVLGSSATTVSALCKSASINRWSKYKPIEYPSPNPTRSGTWYKGANGHCGFKYANAMATSPSGVKACYSLVNNGWTSEDIPSTYFRLLDFDKYYHNAVPPVTNFTCTSKVSTSGTIDAACARAPYISSDSDGAGSLSFSDIGVYYNGELVSLSDMYFGIVLYNGDTKVGIRTSSTKGDLQIQVAASSFTLSQGTTYTVYPVLSSVCYTSVKDLEASGCYIALPEVSPATLSCVSVESANNISLKTTAAYVYASDGTTITGIAATATFTNSGSAITLSGNYLGFRFTTSTDSTTLSKGEYQYTVSDFTIAAKGTKTVSFSYTTSNGFDSSNNYKVIFSFGSGKYKREVNIFKLTDSL
jgi:hypothetical protein